MVDATSNLVEEVNGDWRGADAPAPILIVATSNITRPILDVTNHGKQALKATYPAEILDNSSSDLICESLTCG
jgi:hypothetical protein